MSRDMLCYCLNLTYDDVRRLWDEGYFNRQAEHQAGNYCTSCKGDLAWFLGLLAQEEKGEAVQAVRPALAPVKGGRADLSVLVRSCRERDVVAGNQAGLKLPEDCSDTALVRQAPRKGVKERAG